MGLIGKIVRATVEDSIRSIVSEIWEDYTKESWQILPPGIDATPLKDDQGVVIELGTPGKSVHIGVYADAKAEKGEVRIYSRDENGGVKAEIWLKNDGTIKVNDGDKDAARKDDETESTMQEDTTFWTWISAVHTALQSTPANGTVAASLPTSLKAKITQGTDKVKLP